MKTKISNLGNVLSKKQLTNIHGSIIPILIQVKECSTICVNAARGTNCVSGGSHCPGICDGYGGFYNI